MGREKDASRRKTIFGSLAMDATGRATKAELASPARDDAEEVTHKTRATRKPEGETVEEHEGFRFKRVKRATTEEEDALTSRSVNEQDENKDLGGNTTSRENAEETEGAELSTRLEDTVPAYPAVSAEAADGSVYLHELTPDTLPEDERLLQICESACLLETDLAKVTYVQEQDVFVQDAVSEILREFQLEVEYLLVEGNLSFGQREAEVGGVGEGEQSMLEARKATLRTLVKKYESEDNEWEQLLEQCAGSSAGPPASQVSACKKAAEEAAAQVGTGSFKGKVTSACSDAFRKISLQVAGAQAVVRAAEDLCLQADRVGVQVATKHSVKEFRGLPLINSPQELIRRLTNAASANDNIS